MTCVCLYRPADGAWPAIERSWTFSDPVRRPEAHAAEMLKARDEIQPLLADAPFLYAFNGAEFDLPILGRWLSHSVGPWMAKLVDPLYAARWLMGTGACIKLDVWLTRNGMETKSASGLEAVRMAAEERFQDLADYCMRDTRLTHLMINAARAGPVPWNDRYAYHPFDANVLFTHVAH